MKGFALFFGSIVFLLTVSFGYSQLANAHTFRADDNVVLGEESPINSTLFLAGRTIDIGSEVNGDVFCAGGSVNINSTVQGDVICAAQSVTITGQVDGDIRIAAQTVTVNGEVTGNATLLSQTFVLGSNSRIGQDISLTGTDATFNGEVGRDIAAVGTNVIIAGEIGRDIEATATSLELTSAARVQGSVALTSENEVRQADGAIVLGEITRNQPAATSGDFTIDIDGGVVFGWAVYLYLSLLLVAMVLALVVPRFLQATTDNAIPRPWKALGVGVVASIFVPFVLFMVSVTIVGLPLAILLTLLWWVVLLLSGPVFGYYIGRMIVRKATSAPLIMFVGASVLLLLYFIPVVNIVALLAALWIGVGMVLLELFKLIGTKQHKTKSPTSEAKKSKASAQKA